MTLTRFIALVLAGTSRAAPLIVGIAGGSGCGKTTLANKIVELVGRDVVVVSTDAYYRSLSEEDHQRALRGEINFDRPEALDLQRLVKDVQLMKSDAAWPLTLPSYNFLTHRSESESGVRLHRPKAVLLEGLFVLSVSDLRGLLDIRLFARDDVDICLVQRLRRDAAERGIQLNAALLQYEMHVKPAYDSIVGPSSRYADLVIPAATNNTRAAEVVSGWILNRADNASGLAAQLKSTCAVIEGTAGNQDVDLNS